MAVTYLFIDIDNTILDFDAFVHAAMRDGFEKFALPPFEEWMYDVFCEVNDVLWGRIEQGTGTLEDVRKNRWNLIFDRLGIKADGPVFESYFRAYLHECVIPVDGAFEAIQELSKRYILCAASNGPYEQQVYRLNKAGIDRYFTGIFISEQIGASKPSAAFFSECIRRLESMRDDEKSPQAGPGRTGHIRPDEIMMIGDSISADMSGAASFGLKTCFYDHARKGSGGVKTDLVIGSMRELTQVL